MITLSNGMKLTDEDVTAIYQALPIHAPPPSKRISMNEAARELGVKCSTQKSLSAAFSKFSSPRHYSSPLRSFRVGKVREYDRQDVIEFRDRISKVRH